MRIDAIHAFADNFIWRLAMPDRHEAVVVDPGDAGPVIEALEADGQQLAAILITHKHGDHVGGLRQLKARWPEAVVYGPRHEPIAGLDRALGEGDRIRPEGLAAEFTVLEVPGHTEGHLAYYCEQEDTPVLFCGDTLFSIGCGRVFSGTFEQLHDSLMRLRALPETTRVHCAHEYTLDNIGFAKWVEPDNPDLLAREAECHALLDAGHDTVPSTMVVERAANPFLRVDQPSVVAAVERHEGRPMRDTLDTFTCLRRWKDNEYD